jgi:hypothetical protein
MPGDLERVLRGLQEAQEFAQKYRFEMTDDYRDLIVRVEALSRNQSGADKSGRWAGSLADARTWLAAVRPAPRK